MTKGADFRKAKGVLPWKEGDELPEDTIRRLRGWCECKWISVEDRLPELPGWVIAMTNRREVLPAIYDGCEWKNDLLEDFQDFEFVTHWMPLPPPPESEE